MKKETIKNDFENLLIIAFTAVVLFFSCLMAKGQTSTDTVKGEKLKKSVQCTATTKKGEHCKHMTYNLSKKCAQHDKK